MLGLQLTMVRNWAQAWLPQQALGRQGARVLPRYDAAVPEALPGGKRGIQL
jgi:hypothetical protein